MHALSSIDSIPAMDPDVWARLEKLAAAAGRSVSELAGAVLRDFVDENERHLAAIAAGVAAADAGDLISIDEVEADLEKKIAALSARR